MRNFFVGIKIYIGFRIKRSYAERYKETVGTKKIFPFPNSATDMLSKRFATRGYCAAYSIWLKIRKKVLREKNILLR